MNKRHINYLLSYYRSHHKVITYKTADHSYPVYLECELNKTNGAFGVTNFPDTIQFLASDYYKTQWGQ